jgi:glycosyltransferase involved in cell wall biosynthesis
MSRRPLRIAVHADAPAVRGSEVQSLLLARELVARGHHVAASCRAGSPVREAFELAGIPTTTARPRGDADLASALGFARWLRRERTDALLVTSWVRAFGAGWAARRAGVRVVLRLGGIHGLHSPVEAWKYRHALGRWYDAVIANSRYTAESLLREMPALDPSKVRVVPNGHLPASTSPAPLRSEHPIPADAVLLAAVGGMERNKGFHVLLPALARLDAGVHLAVAGDGKERPNLQSLAESLGIVDRVHWLGHRRDVPAVLAAADAFVLSSLREGMAVAMMEAVAARLPVVATEVGGAWELLAARDGRPAGGWIVPRNDAAALAAALADLVRGLRANPSAVRARADEAFGRLTSEFTVQRMVDGYEAVLRGDRVG